MSKIKTIFMGSELPPGEERANTTMVCGNNGNVTNNATRRLQAWEPTTDSPTTDSSQEFLHWKKNYPTSQSHFVVKKHGLHEHTRRNELASFVSASLIKHKVGVA